MALQYGTSSPITISSSVLTSTTARSSAAVTSGTTNNTTYYLVTVSILTTTSTPAGNKQIAVYAYRSEDGTTYQGSSASFDNVDGTSKDLAALGSPTNLTFLGTIQLNQGALGSALTVKQVFSLSQAFGSIPPKWGIVLYNDSGISTGATITASYREVYYS